MSKKVLIGIIVGAVVLVSVIVGMVAIIISGNANNESEYWGTWDIHSVNIEGSLFTIEEIEAMGDYSMSDFRITIKEGGKAYVYSQGDGDFVDWTLTEEGINIGSRVCTIQDDMLTLEVNDNMMYFTKTSDKQTITAPDVSSNDNNGEANNTHTHIGGVATCTEKAVCSICNEQYGQFNSTNHSSGTFSYIINSADSTKHDKKYACCGVVMATVAHSGGAATTTQKAICEYCNASYGNVLSSFNWQLAGNGCGARIPEPSFEYDVKASFTYLCVEVYNTTEEDFYDYVDECRTYGFNGTVGSATSPDLYYVVYDAEEYYLEVFYYADDEYIYVYIRPPYSDSNDNDDDNNIGLEYSLSDDETYYIVSDIGDCTESNIIIPSQHKGLPVKAVGSYAFFDCDSIESIVLPNSLIEIEDCAFYNCKSIETLIIPNSVITIGEEAFAYCESVKNLQIGENVESIGYGAFSHCISIESVDIPNSVSIIDDYAFSNCYSLINVNIGNHVTTIGEGSFYWCSSMTEIVIPANVTYIGYEAFYNCESVRTVIIYRGVTQIDDYAFCLFAYPVDLYYTGSESDWKQISMDEDSGNFYITGNIHYNYVP